MATIRAATSSNTSWTVPAPATAGAGPMRFLMYQPTREPRGFRPVETAMMSRILRRRFRARRAGCGVAEPGAHDLSIGRIEGRSAVDPGWPSRASPTQRSTRLSACHSKASDAKVDHWTWIVGYPSITNSKRPTPDRADARACPRHARVSPPSKVNLIPILGHKFQLIQQLSAVDLGLDFRVKVNPEGGTTRAPPASIVRETWAGIKSTRRTDSANPHRLSPRPMNTTLGW
jgi:hypothetical protein